MFKPIIHIRCKGYTCRSRFKRYLSIKCIRRLLLTVYIFVFKFTLDLRVYILSIVLDKSMPQNNKYSSTYMKVKSHLGHIKIENTIIFIKNQYAKIKLQKIQQTFRKMVLFEKVNTSRPISLFGIQKYFLMRKYISCTNKNRKKLDLSILSTVLKLFFENCKQYTYRFFSNHTSIKILWQRLFWFLFFNIQCMYI